MIKRVAQFIFGQRATLPLEIEQAPEWTEADADALSNFMRRTVAGERLRKILTAELYLRAVTPGLKDAYAQGLHDGQALLLGRILNLAKDKEETEDVE